MGLKTFKWLYRLGVEQERTRIAHLLERELAARRVHSDTSYGMLMDEKTLTSKARKAKLERSYLVNEEVQSIINALFQVRYEDQVGKSLMYPEEMKQL